MLKINRGRTAYIELLPVQDGLLRGLLNGHGGAALANGGTTSANLPALWQGSSGGWGLLCERSHGRGDHQCRGQQSAAAAAAFATGAAQFGDGNESTVNGVPDKAI